MISRALDALAIDGAQSDEQKQEYKRQLMLKETQSKRAQALCEELMMTKEDKAVMEKRE